MTKPTRIRPILLLFLGAAPALLAGLLTAKQPEGRSIVGTRERSSLVFSQYAVHLGEVRPVGTIPAHFDFVNAGDEPINILKLEPSCGCLAPRLYDDKQVYQPGERGRFYVSVKTANESPGPKDYTVKVLYDDGQPQERLVSFRLSVPEKKVSVTPAEVYFYQTNGKADTRELQITDHRGRDLNVLDVVSSSDLAQVFVGKKQNNQGITTTPIRIDVPADVPPGKNISLITIETDDPDYRLIKVPVLIWGPNETIQQVSGEATDKE